LAQLMQLRIAGPLAGEPRGQALHRRPDGDHLDDLALGLAHHIDAAARHGAHETLLLQHGHRLADRGAADAEIEGELALVQADLAGMAVDVHFGDRPLYGVAGELAQSGGDGDPLQLELRRRHDLRHLRTSQPSFGPTRPRAACGALRIRYATALSTV